MYCLHFSFHFVNKAIFLIVLPRLSFFSELVKKVFWAVLIICVSGVGLMAQSNYKKGYIIIGLPI